MMNLLDAKSSSQYMEVCQRIRGKLNKYLYITFTFLILTILGLAKTYTTRPSFMQSLIEWVKQKERLTIRCGFNKHNSKIQPDDWDNMSSSSNPAEVQHQRSYLISGRYSSLLSVIAG